MQVTLLYSGKEKKGTEYQFPLGKKNTTQNEQILKPLNLHFQHQIHSHSLKKKSPLENYLIISSYTNDVQSK